MASLRNFNNNGKSGKTSFKNPALRKLSGRGYDYMDSVIKNSEAIGSVENKIGWQENNDLLRFGYNFDNFDQLYDFSYSDVYSKKNIPFFDQNYPSKLEQLKKYAVQDEIEMILDTLTDELMVYDTEKYFAKIKWEVDPDIKKPIAQTIEETLQDNYKRVYNLLGFRNENTAWHYVKKFLIEGFLSFEIIWDDSSTNIIGFKELDAVTLTPKIYKDGTRGWVQFPLDPVKKRELTDSQVIFISFSAINGEDRISYTERLIRAFNLLRIMEQSRIIWAVVNSSYRTKFIIPVGGKSKTMAKQTIGSLMQSYRENIDFDNDSGELRVNGKSMLPFSKEYWIPESNSGTPQIENIGNDGPDLSDTESLKYFINKLIQVSKIPKNRFYKDETPTWEGSAESYTREEIYFSRFLDRMRAKLEEIVLKPTLLQTKRDIPELADDRLFDQSVTMNWVAYDIFEKLKEYELLEKQLNVIQTARESLMSMKADGTEEHFFSQTFLVKKILDMSTNDLKTNLKMREAEEQNNEASVLGDEEEEF
jgi:hypothetical protein